MVDILSIDPLFVLGCMGYVHINHDPIYPDMVTLDLKMWKLRADGRTFLHLFHLSTEDTNRCNYVYYALWPLGHIYAS